MADLQAVQSRLSASLDAVGYSKAVGTLPASLERNKKLCRFVELVAEQTKPANYLNPEQARRCCDDNECYLSSGMGNAPLNCMPHLVPPPGAWPRPCWGMYAPGHHPEGGAFDHMIIRCYSIGIIIIMGGLISTCGPRGGGVYGASQKFLLLK